MNKRLLRLYVPALFVIAIWSSTFISTKILLDYFSPLELLLIRFILAWLCMFVAHPKVYPITNWKNEGMFALAGLLGGSLYFLAENFALEKSLASNVSLLVSTAPLLTAIAAHYLLHDEKIGFKTILGATVSFMGAGMVILNGTFILRLNPIGDLLALSSALAWALYSIVIKRTKTELPSLYVTRKIFFYTVITALPFCLASPFTPDLANLAIPKVLFNLAFLTVFASCAAYLIWNSVIRKMGASKANTLIYFIPILTFIESSLILGEPITAFAVTGALLIISGVWFASR